MDNRIDKSNYSSNKRNSNIEALRIICILLIITMHILGPYSEKLGTAGVFALCFNTTIGQFGVSVLYLSADIMGLSSN